MSKIYQRKDGRWAGQVWVTTSTGQRKRKTIYGASRQEVRQKITLFNVEVATKGYIETSDMSVEQFLDEWIENLDSVRFNTKNSYADNIRLHIVPHLGNIKLQKLRPLDIQRLLSTLKGKGLSPRTCQYVFSILRKALNQAVKWNMLNFNPTDGVDRPRVPKYQIEPLTVEEARKFLDTAKEMGDPFYPLFVLAISTGMRAGELLGLEWEDVDLKNSRLSVRHTLINKTKTLAEPKTAKARRVIELTGLAVDVLKDHRKKQTEARLQESAWDSTYNLVFPTGIGTPFDHSHLTQRHFHPILEQAGLRKIRFHDLRHTAATLLLQAGEHPKVVQEMLGHSTISMTLDTYSHVIPSMQKEAARKMDEMLKESPSYYPRFSSKKEVS